VTIRCLAACDANGDGDISGGITDAIFLLTFNLIGGTPPPAPFPECGAGNEFDEQLTCESGAEVCQ
jgi:hypothetical protein